VIAAATGATLFVLLTWLFGVNIGHPWVGKNIQQIVVGHSFFTSNFLSLKRWTLVNFKSEV